MIFRTIAITFYLLATGPLMAHATESPSGDLAQPLQALLEAPALHVDPSLVANAVGDMFEKGTKLDGYGESFQRFHEFLDRKIEVLEILSSHHSALDPMTFGTIPIWKHLQDQLAKAIDLGEAYSDDIGTFRQKMHELILPLDIDDSILLPFGWPGHAAVLEFIRETPSTFAVRVYNGGEGVGFHMKAIPTTELEAFPFVEICAVPEGNILALSFLLTLQEFRTEKWYLSPKAEHLYDLILPMLGGKPSPHRYSYSQMTPPQISLTCSYISSLYAIRNIVRFDPLASRLDMEFRLKALLDFDPKAQDNEALSWRLLSKALQYLSIDLLSSREQDLFSEEELIYINSRLSAVAKEVEVRLTDDLPLKRRPRHDIDLNAKPPIGLDYTVHGEDIAYYAPFYKDESKSTVPAEAYIEAIQLDDPITPETLVHTLRERHALVEQLLERKNRQEVVMHITDLAKALPLYISVTLWDDLSAKDGEEALELLASLATKYLTCFNGVGDTPLLSSVATPEAFLALAKLLTVAHQIVYEVPELASARLPDLYPGSFEAMLHDPARFRILDPSWHQEWIKLMEYWDATDSQYSWLRNTSTYRKVRGVKLWDHLSDTPTAESDKVPVSFFGYEAYPAGTGVFSNTGSKAHPRKVFVTEQGFVDYYTSHHEVHPDRTWDLEIFWQDVDWIKYWLSKEENAQRLAEENAEVASWDLDTQAVLALADEVYFVPQDELGKPIITQSFEAETPGFDRSVTDTPRREGRLAILPSWFFSLRDLSFSVNHLLTGRKFPLSNSRDPRVKVYAVQKVVYIASVARHVVYWELWHAFDDLSTQSHWEDGVVQYRKKDFETVDPSFRINQTTSSLTDAELDKLFVEEVSLDDYPDYLIRQRLPTNTAVLLDPKRDRDTSLPLELFRSILQLSSDPDLQIHETLEFFHARPQLLSEAKYQNLLEHLLLDKHLFLTQLREHPADAQTLCDNLASLCLQSYETATEVGDVSSALFYVKLNRLLADQVYFWLTTNQFLEAESWSPHFFDSRQATRDILSVEGLESTTKILAYVEQALSYQFEKSLSSEDLTELLYAIFCYNLYSSSASEIGIEKEFQLRNLLYRLRSVIQSSLETSDEQLIFDHVASELLPDTYTSTLWQGKFPYYWTDDVSIDLLGGRIAAKSAYVPIPRALRASEEMMEAIGIIPDSMCHSDAFSSSVEFTNTLGNTFLYSEEELSGTRYGNKVEKLTRLFPKLSETYSADIERGRFINLRGAPYLLPNLRGLLANYHTWHTGNSVVLTDKVTQQPQYVVEYELGPDTGVEGEPPPICIKAVRHLNSSGFRSGTVLHHIKDTESPFHWLSDFEHPDYVLVWQNEETGRPFLIEFPRFQLRLEAVVEDGVTSWTCPALGDAKLMAKQTHPELKHLRHYLIFETAEESGEDHSFVIMADQHFGSTLSQSSLDTLALMEQSAWGNHKQTYLRYQNNSQGQLVPSDRYSRLYLAHVFLYLGEYSRANELMRGEGGSLGPLTERERSLLSEITCLYEKNQDYDPIAIALRIQAAYWILHYNDLYNFEPSISLSFAQDISYNLERLYRVTRYLNPFWFQPEQLNSNRWLSEDEERRVLEWCLNVPKLEAGIELKRRHQELNGKTLSPHLAFPNTLQRNKTKIPDANDFIWNIVYNWEGESHILSPDLSCKFVKFYQLARGEGSLQEQIEQLSDMISAPLPDDITLAELRSTLTDILHLMSVEYDGIQRVVAHILNTVCADPNAFPESDEIAQLLEQWKDRNLRENANQDMEWWLLEPIRNMAPVPKDDRIVTGNLVLTGVEWLQRRQQRKAKYGFVNPVPIEMQQCPNLPDQDLSSAYSNKSTLWPLIRSAVSRDDRGGLNDQLFALSQVLQSETGETYVDLNMQALSKRVGVEIGRRLDELQSPTVTSWEDIQAYLAALVKQEHTLGASLKELEHEILALANHLPKDPVAHTEANLKRLGQLRSSLSLDDVIYLYFRRDLEEHYFANPHLTEDLAHQLSTYTQDYLLIASQIQHVNRLKEATDFALKAHDQSAGSVEEGVALDQLYSLGQESRLYSPSEHPEYLVFEYYMSALLRPQQVSMLDELNIAQGRVNNPASMGKVIEMIMGSGKTKFLLPLIASLHADGDHLSIVVMPEPLIATMSIDLQKRVGRAFRKGAELIEISRETELSTKELRLLVDRLQEAKSERRVVFISNSSLQSLYLNFVAKVLRYIQTDSQPETESVAVLDNVKAWVSWALSVDLASRPDVELSFDSEIEATITLFRELFTLLKRDSWVTIDEVDFVLDVLKSHHYSMGSKIPPHPEMLSCIADLYEYLTVDDRVDTLFQLPFSRKDAEASQHLLSFSEGLQPYIVSSILDGKLSQSDEVNSAIDSLDWSRTSLSQYLMNEDKPSAFRLVRSQSSEAFKNVMGILHEELNTLLPLTLNKQLYVHYGPIPESEVQADPSLYEERYIAIPYHMGKPAIKSRFGSELESLNYTIQMHLERGVSQEIVDRELDQIRTIIHHHGIPTARYGHPASIKALERFECLTGANPDYNVMSLTDRDKMAITAHINGSPHHKMALIRSYILPQIRGVERQIDANAQLYGMLFDAVQGFSGTVWNADTYPDIFGDVQLSNTEERTLFLLWTTSPHEVITVSSDTLNRDYAQIFVDQTYAKAATLGSVIDAGGVLRGISNYDVVHTMINHPTWESSPIRHVVYYDADDALMTLTRGQEEPRPYTQGEFAKETLIAFWDQSHTTGSDIPLQPSMHALVTAGIHTISRDFLQAVWRLRQLHQGQQVQIVVSEEDWPVIAQTLELDSATKPRLEHIIQYTLRQQYTTSLDHNYRALKQKLTYLVLGKLWQLVVDDEIPNSDVGTAFHHLRELFETINNSQPHTYLGLYQKETDTEKTLFGRGGVLEGFLHSYPVQAFKSVQPLQAKSSFDQLQYEAHSLLEIALPHLPSTILREDNYKKEVAIEVEKEVEQETEVEQEHDRLYSKYGLLPFLKPLPVVQWPCHLMLEELSLSCQHAPESAMFPNDPLLIGVNHVLQKRPGLATPFSNRLLGTKNLFPDDPNGIQDTPFLRYQKDFTRALVIQDKDSAEHVLVLLDHNDAKQLDSCISRDTTFHADCPETRHTNLGLMLLNSGVYRHSACKLDQQLLEADQELPKLLVQAKFLQGETFYTEDECAYLEEWIAENNPEKMYELFYMNILAYKEQSRETFPNSSIYTVFSRFIDLDGSK